MFLFYLDESGEREYESGSRYFTPCALGISAEQWHALDQQIRQAKIDCFGRADVEIKSSWLRRERERQKRYIQPYNISKQALSALTTQVYNALLEHQTVILACVVDKHAMQVQFTEPEPAVVKAYLTLLNQIETFLEAQQTYGIVVFDKINESQFKKYGYEAELAKQHALWRQRVAGEKHTTRVVEGLLFLPSHEHNFIQLADLCAYNIYRQFVEYGDEWQTGFVNRYPYFEWVESRLACDEQGNYRGYGLKQYP